jgi:hypothetical protein
MSRFKANEYFPITCHRAYMAAGLHPGKKLRMPCCECQASMTPRKVP